MKIKTCEVMQYFDYLDTQDEKEIANRIENLTNLKTYCLCVHDKDLKDNGDIKPRHFHAVLTFRDTTTTKAVAKALHIEEQYVNKIRCSTATAELYLIHKNHPEKYQYDLKDVIANFDYEEKYDGYEPKQRLEEIANRIASGEIKAYNLTDYIGVDFYAKHKRYIDNCFNYRISLLKGNGREMNCVFITGDSGVGKTTLAKFFATQKGYATYISSGGNNPLDDYKGQECIILDDIRDNIFRLSDFLKLADNNTDSLVGCRFYNKSIKECKMLIVTSTKDIKNFYFNATEEEKEPQKQLFRRFSLYVKLDKEHATFYQYDETQNKYVYLTTQKNPTSILFSKKVYDDFANTLIDTLGEDKLAELVENLENGTQTNFF